MKQFTLAIMTSLISLHLGAQTYSSRLIDAKTQKGIPYATIQYGESKGVISNEEGRFSFTMERETFDLDSIYISSMGYEKAGFSLERLQDSVIVLMPKTIKLGGVYVFDNPLEVDEIIALMKERLPQNMNNAPIRQRYFLRQSVFSNIEKIDFGFEKSSIEELNKELIDSIGRTIPRNSYHYTETLGDFYKADNNYKIAILKAAELYDKQDIASFEDFGERMESMLKKHVKPDSYLKIKSGIFSEKVPVEEVLEDLEAEKTLDEDKKEAKGDTISGVVNGQKHIFKELLNEVFYQEDSKLDLIEKTRKYQFELAGYTDIDDEGVYVIDFSPKGGADFKGRIYINIEDYGVMRIDFENLKNLRNFRLLGIFYRETIYRGTMRFSKLPNNKFENLKNLRNFRLLGIFYRETIYRGTMRFSKLPNNKYDIKFADFTFGRWFRLDRPLDVIEKNKNVKGRRKQNELRLNIDFRMANNNKWELVVYDQTLIDQSQFDAHKEDKSIKATYMPRYNPEFWKGYTIMEPNQAIREFSVD